MGHVKNISSHIVKLRAHTPLALHTAAAAKSSTKGPPKQVSSYRYRFSASIEVKTTNGTFGSYQLPGLANRSQSFGEASALKPPKAPTPPSSKISAVSAGFGVPMMLGMVFMVWRNPFGGGG